MKLKLELCDVLDREIIKMFLGRNAEEGFIVGISDFGIMTVANGEFQNNYSVIIDIEKCRMDLRVAIGTNIKFDIDCGDGEYARGYKLTRINQLDNGVAEYDFEDIEGIAYCDVQLCDFIQLKTQLP